MSSGRFSENSVGKEEESEFFRNALGSPKGILYIGFKLSKDNRRILPDKP